MLKSDPTPAKASLKWKWASLGAFDVSALGNPASTDDLTLCLADATGYQAQATATAGGTCAGGKPCWTLATGKVKYKNKDATAEGVINLQGKTGIAKKGKLSVQGKGANLEVPALPLSTPVKAYLIREDGSACWSSTFSAPSKNEAGAFKAKSD